jgi:hypothetical protein
VARRAKGYRSKAGPRIITHPSSCGGINANNAKYHSKYQSGRGSALRILGSGGLSSGGGPAKIREQRDDDDQTRAKNEVAPPTVERCDNQPAGLAFRHSRKEFVMYFEVHVVAAEFRREMLATAAPHFSGISFLTAVHQKNSK